jgi:lipoprotein NlpI
VAVQRPRAQRRCALAKTELEAIVKKQRNDDWPEPVAEFYLGKLDARGLLNSAADDKKSAHARTCMANAHMREWHAARGENAQAEALLATLRSECAPARPAAAPAVAADQ